MAHTWLPAAAAAYRKLSPAAFGLFTMLHSTPFQCMASVLKVPKSGRCVPTAHTSSVESAATPYRTLCPDALGLGTFVHSVPSQCSMRVCWSPVLEYIPTAHASVAEIPVTA